MHLQPGQQRAGPHGLRHVVVCPDFQTHDFVRFITSRGEDQNDPLITGPHQPADVDTVQAGQVDIEDDSVRLFVTNPVDGRIPSPLNRSHHPVHLQKVRHHRRQGRVVFDQQNPMARFRNHESPLSAPSEAIWTVSRLFESASSASRPQATTRGRDERIQSDTSVDGFARSRSG